MYRLLLVHGNIALMLSAQNPNKTTASVIVKKFLPKDPATLFVEFDSGECFEIPYIELRFACPCATCVDEMTGKRTIKKENLRADVRPRHVEPVGRYGLKITWSDGHATGMFHFETIYQVAKQASSQKLN
jgi:DUF971 family protein